jgi:hypothetical protein
MTEKPYRETHICMDASFRSLQNLVNAQSGDIEGYRVIGFLTSYKSENLDIKIVTIVRLDYHPAFRGIYANKDGRIAEVVTATWVEEDRKFTYFFTKAHEYFTITPETIKPSFILSHTEKDTL